MGWARRGFEPFRARERGEGGGGEGGGGEDASENGGKLAVAVVGGNSLQSTRSAFNNALPRTLGDLEREPITVEWNRMVFGPLIAVATTTTTTAAAIDVDESETGIERWEGEAGIMSDPAEYAATFRVARILVERRPTEVRANSLRT